jgi:cytochrome c peroxidase
MSLASKIMKNIIYLSAALLVLTMYSCKKDNIESTPYTPTAYELTVPDHFPPPYLSNENPLTVEGVRLGRMLYYDPILSTNGLSCTSCHEPSKSFSTGIYTAPSGEKISVPPHVNLAWNPDYNWTGSEPILNHLPMGDFSPTIFNTDMALLVTKFKSHALYPTLFKQAFNIDDVASLSHHDLQVKIALAITQFLRTMVSSDTKLDRVMRHEATFTPQEWDGYVTFTTETGDCFHCHGYPLMTSNIYSNNGLELSPQGTNQGRYLVTGNPTDIGKYSIPTLRNIALTAPYMHDGRFQTLEEVVEFYNSGVQWNSPNIDPIMTKPAKIYGLNLTPTQKANLVLFLKALTDSTFMNNPNYKSPL